MAASSTRPTVASRWSEPSHSTSAPVRNAFPSAIGSIIRVVAVLETHIDRNAVEIIIPRMICRGWVPTRRRVSSAIRRCRFHFCIAMAMRKPPRKRKTMELA